VKIAAVLITVIMITVSCDQKQEVKESPSASDYGLIPSLTDSEVKKQPLTLHFNHRGKTFTTHWIHDYTFKNGTSYFYVSTENGRIKGLLDVNKIDKEKTDAKVYETAKRFARYITSKAKKIKNAELAKREASKQSIKASEKHRANAVYNARPVNIKYQTVTCVSKGGGMYYCTFRKDVLSSYGVHNLPVSFKGTVKINSSNVRRSSSGRIHPSSRERSILPGGRSTPPKKRAKVYLKNKKGWIKAAYSITLYTGYNNTYYTSKQEAIKNLIENMPR